MALSLKAKRLFRVAFGNKIYGNEVTAAINANTVAAPVLVATSVIGNIVSFSDYIGTCQDSGVDVADIATALAYHIDAASHALGAVAPTEAECIAEIGAIADTNGEAHIILSSNDATKTYTAASDGVTYFQLALTKTL